MVISIAELVCISLAGFGDWFELGLLWPAQAGEMGLLEGQERSVPFAWLMGPYRGQMPGDESSLGVLALCLARLEQERGFCCDPSYHPTLGDVTTGSTDPAVDLGLNSFSWLLHPGRARSGFC